MPITKSYRLSPYELFLRQRITEIFKLFDKNNDDTISSSDLGTFIRCLYLCPTESEVDDVLKMVEDSKVPDTIHLKKVMPVMLDIMKKDRFKPVDAKLLNEAFEYLDKEKKHFLTTQEIEELFTTYGEPFTKQEIENMLDFAVNTRENRLYYRSYIPSLVITEEEYLKGRKTRKRTEIEKQSKE